jgi:hypothetical protein
VSLATVKVRGAVAEEEPVAAPAATRLTVSTPFTVTALLALVAAPFAATVIASARPVAAVPAKVAVVLVLVDVTWTLAKAFRPVTVTSLSELLLKMSVTPDIRLASTETGVANALALTLSCSTEVVVTPAPRAATAEVMFSLSVPALPPFRMSPEVSV